MLGGGLLQASEGGATDHSEIELAAGVLYSVDKGLTKASRNEEVYKANSSINERDVRTRC